MIYKRRRVRLDQLDSAITYRTFTERRDRCYFLDQQAHIEVAEDIDADELSEAIDKALAMLQQRPRYRSVEIWEGAKRLYPANRIL